MRWKAVGRVKKSQNKQAIQSAGRELRAAKYPEGEERLLECLFTGCRWK